VQQSQATTRSTRAGALPNAASGNAAAPRVLIVDDHVLVRDGLRELLKQAFPGARLGEAGTGAEALEHAASQPWDVVLLDINLPGSSGLDVLKQLLNSSPNTAVLVLSMHPEDQYAIRVLEAGASGYIPKDADGDQIIAAVKKSLAGGRYITDSVAQALAANPTPSAVLSPHQSLSPRENQVMLAIAGGRSSKEISLDLSLSVKTVSTYRARILKKLNLATNAALIRYALDHKLIN
jgi:two-component system invasion response regulator UvrY